MTNLVGLIISILGLLLTNEHIKDAGFYALSGAITNWLAVIMLFDKVPFIYGSGVIPRQFESFKYGIKKILMSQFFQRKQLEKFLFDILAEKKKDFKKNLGEAVNYDLLFDRFIEVIMESQFGSVIDSFLGGKTAIEPIRGPFRIKIEKSILEISDSLWAALETSSSRKHMNDDILNKLDTMIDARLNEMTPKMVKVVIQDMIRNHLSWLVVWGGIFGATIGTVVSFT